MFGEDLLSLWAPWGGCDVIW